MDRGAMTEISGNNLGFLMGDERSPRQMVEFLKEGARLRSWGAVPRPVCPRAQLAEGPEYAPEPGSPFPDQLCPGT